MDPRPSYRVGAAGLDPRDWRLIEIVFKHSQYNRYEFTLIEDLSATPINILIVNTTDSAAVKVAAGIRASGRPVPIIAAVPRGAPSAARHAISIDRLTLQLLPILNRVVELELSSRQGDAAGFAPTATMLHTEGGGVAADTGRPPTGATVPAAAVGAVAAVSAGAPAREPGGAPAGGQRAAVAPAGAAPQGSGRPSGIAAFTGVTPAGFGQPGDTLPVPRRDEPHGPAGTGAAGAGGGGGAAPTAPQQTAGRAAQRTAGDVEAGGRRAGDAPTRGGADPVARRGAEPSSGDARSASNLVAFPSGNVVEPPRPQRLRVLVIDDSPTVRQQLTIAFERMGMACETAANAQAALARLAQQHFDLALVDVIMPEMDGYKLTREIKRNKRTRQLPVIILTSKSSPFDLARGALAGCDSFLSKPVPLKALEAAVVKHLRKSLAIDDLSSLLRPLSAAPAAPPDPSRSGAAPADRSARKS